jgi:hypothetical protein
MQLSPYRRATDNRIAVFARWLVFLWAFGLLLRLDGILGSMPSVVVGLALVLATLAVVEEALRLSIMEMRKYLRTRRRESAADEEDEAPDSAATEQDRGFGESKTTETEAGLAQPAQPAGSVNESGTVASSPGQQQGRASAAGMPDGTAGCDSSSFWVRVLGPSLCVAQSQQLDDSTTAVGGGFAAILAEKEAELLTAEQLLAEKDQTIANHLQTAQALLEKDKANEDALLAKDMEISRLRGPST